MKPTIKKIISVACASALAISLVACGSDKTTTSKYADTTITGQITAIDDSSITVTIGELSEESADSSDNSSAPEKPADGDDSSAPEKPADGDDSSAPEKPADGDDSSAPEKPADDDDSSAPEKPADGSESPAKPEGDSDNSSAPEMPGNMTHQTFTAGDDTATVDVSEASIVENSKSISVSDLEKDDIIQITFNSKGVVTYVTTVSLDGNSGFGGSGEVTQGSSANTIDQDGDYTDQVYKSTGDDENALRVDGATATLEGITVNKSEGSSSNTEDGDFYGMNAALLATNGANVTIKNATVKSSAQNGNGVFSYGEGTTVNISNSKITTTADNSGGIQTTGGGTTNATNLTVKTSGNSSAAIRSDRGGGTVNVKKGTYTSNGYNSPAVYSTADISVSDATLTANNSEALVIEGENSITLTDCDVTGNMSDTKGSSSDENVHNVMIYQSMSGDAEEGTSSFNMTGGTLTSKNGDMFYVTNTHCVLKLSGVAIKNQDSDAYLLNICGNSASHGWGTAGSNGAQVDFTADNQTLDGNIIVDSISTLNMTLSGNSTFTGTVNIVDNAAGGTAVSDNAVVTVEKGSTWTLTGDCTLTSLTNNGTINFNGHTITLADGTVLK